MRALLDVNVLIALLDSAHVHHDHAREWFTANIDAGWASCPITQNGCIRILSSPAYPGNRPPAMVARHLRAATETEWHSFWPDDHSLLERGCLNWKSILGSRQLTDAYLLSLAVHHQGRFVTLDQGVPIDAVPGARPGHLVIL